MFSFRRQSNGNRLPWFRCLDWFYVLLLPLACRAFSKYNKKIDKMAEASANEEMLAASNELHDLCHVQVFQATVSGDGSWMRQAILPSMEFTPSFQSTQVRC